MASVMDPKTLAKSHPHFTTSEIEAFLQQFKGISDKTHDGCAHHKDLNQVASKAGVTHAAVVQKLATMRLDGDYVSFEHFLTAVGEIRREQGIFPLASNTVGSSQKIVLHGHQENTMHTINEDERASFTAHINSDLALDPDVRGRIPMNVESMQIFSECRDGIILAKIINRSVPSTIDERVLNLPKAGKSLNTFMMTENNNLVINSAKAIGCSVVNIGAQDLLEGREHLLLGLIWQIIKIGLTSKISITLHPEIFRLLEKDEQLEMLLSQSAEYVLLRWFNYHLEQANAPRRVNNFSADLRDGEAYTYLLNQLAPKLCSRAPLLLPSAAERADAVLQNAEKIGCRKYLTSRSMLDGNLKLNFAFTANLFNLYPGLEPLSDTERGALDNPFSDEGSREARVFMLWLNSLAVEPYVNNLFEDLKDGLILLQAIEHILPGAVDWKRVNKGAAAASKFKRLENCNYVLALGRELKFTLIGIQGSDITDGVKTLTLGFVWQLMRDNIVRMLQSLSANKTLTDADLIAWANQTAGRHSVAANVKITSFKDDCIKNGLFLLNVINGVKRGVVNPDLIQKGDTPLDHEMNAKYAISVARKLGATIFVLPDDITAVRPKMV